MELTDQISALIFALIVVAVTIYIVMSRFVLGPMAGLMRAERVIVIASVVGILGVMAYAATELLLHIAI